MAVDIRQRQIGELHDATEALREAWDELTQAVARELEGWDDPPDRIGNAHRRVRLATGAANAALERALAEAITPAAHRALAKSLGVSVPLDRSQRDALRHDASDAIPLIELLDAIGRVEPKDGSDVQDVRISPRAASWARQQVTELDYLLEEYPDTDIPEALVSALRTIAEAVA